MPMGEFISRPPAIPVIFCLIFVPLACSLSIVFDYRYLLAIHCLESSKYQQNAIRRRWRHELVLPSISRLLWVLKQRISRKQLFETHCHTGFVSHDSLKQSLHHYATRCDAAYYSFYNFANINKCFSYAWIRDNWNTPSVSPQISNVAAQVYF